MKKFSLVLLVLLALAAIFTFENCNGDKDPSPAEATKNILMSRTWVYSSVNVPVNTATTDSDWSNFSVQFNESDMVTSGHANNNGDATVVWPSTTYTVSEDGKTISRGDGVDMLINTISETNLVVTFGMPPGTEVSRIASLEGDYTFNLK